MLFYPLLSVFLTAKKNVQWILGSTLTLNQFNLIFTIKMYRKVIGKELKIGMFVADLDRPWIDTPFLLQGFLIEDDDQLAQLREFCQWVLVDPQRSTGDEYSSPAKKAPIERRDLGTEPRVQITRAAAPTNAPTAANTQNPTRKSATGAEPRNADAPLTNATGSRDFAVAMKTKTGQHASDSNSVSTHTERGRNSGDPTPAEESGGGLRGFFGQLRESAKNLFTPTHTDTFDDDSIANANIAPQAAVRPGFIPETVQLTIYEDKKTVEEEIKFASAAFARTGELLHSVIEDIRIGNRLELANVEGVIENMVESMTRNPDAMMWVARMREKNASTYGHGLNVAISLVAFGRHLGYPKESLAHLGMLGLLLDVGKIKLPPTLLEKAAALTPKEFEQMKQHVKLGLDELHKTPNIHPDILEGIAQHHERMNGTGYPAGMPGEKISIFGRMSAITDCYAALTEKRVYAEAVSPHEALQMLSNWSGAQFHPDMVEQFIQSIGAFPVGSLVELSTGEVAVVATHNKLKRLKPKVLVVTEPDKTIRKHPRTLDLIYDVSDKPVYIRRGLPNNSFGLDTTEFYLN